MKVSDKICVAPHQIFDYDLDIQEVGHNGAEEYIRKGALLEWLEDYMKGLSDGCVGQRFALLKMIDKLNNM